MQINMIDANISYGTCSQDQEVAYHPNTSVGTTDTKKMYSKYGSHMLMKKTI